MTRTRGMTGLWVALVVLAGGCTTVLDVDKHYYPACASGAVQCAGNTVQSCANGVWKEEMPCINQTCIAGACTGACAPGEAQCAGNTPQTCGANGDWQGSMACMNQTCIAGVCTGDCFFSGAMQCVGNTPQSCDANGQWQDGSVCVSQTCVSGVCTGICAPGDVQCAGNTPQSCGANGDWQNDPECVNQTCVSGVCTGMCAPGDVQCSGNAPQSCGANGDWQDSPVCVSQTCVSGVCTGICAPADVQCVGNTPQTCLPSGDWQDSPACVDQTCVSGACTGVCAPGEVQCAANTPQACGSNGDWENGTPCINQTCIAAMCIGVCAPNDAQCVGNTPQTCAANGEWQDGAACVAQTCIAGACTGVCAPGDVQCVGSTPQSCGATGDWQSGTACDGQSEACVAGSCVPHSCAGLPLACGPGANESCCAITTLPGGSYLRADDPMYPTTVSGFRLDRFEVTVGRFRAFVAAYPGSKPMPGAGTHPLIAGSGWDPAWDAELPADQATLLAGIKCNPTYGKWTDTPGANENHPINCISWYQAFAFCAWDGARLPTEAEWHYAASGGDEQRYYPWSNPPTSATVDPTYAVYECTADGSMPNDCTAADLPAVGSRSPKGDGKWGQADLAGSLWEWNLDGYVSPYALLVCNDCAELQVTNPRVFRGGRFMGTGAIQNMRSRYRSSDIPTGAGVTVGIRCARSP